MSDAHLLQFKSWITKQKTEPLMRWFHDQKTPDSRSWKQLGEQVYLYHSKPMDFLLRFTLGYLEYEERNLSKGGYFSKHHFNTTKLPSILKNMYEGLSDLRPSVSSSSWSLAYAAESDDKLRWTAQWLKHLDTMPPSTTVAQKEGLERTFYAWVLHERYMPIALKHIPELDSIDDQHRFLRTYLRHGHPEDWPVIRQSMLDQHENLVSFHQLLWMTSWQLLAVEPTSFPLVSAYFEWVTNYPNEYPDLMKRFQNMTSFSPAALTDVQTQHGQALDHSVLWVLLRSGLHHAGIVSYAQTQWNRETELTPFESGRYKTMCIAVDMSVPVLELEAVWLNSAAPQMTTYALPSEHDGVAPSLK